MKRNAIVRIVIWSIVLLLLVSFLVTAILFRSFAYQSWNGEHHDENIPMHVLPSEEGVAFNPADVDSLEIEWAAGSIVLQPADVTEITITESDVSEAKYAMLYKLTNNKLTIRFCEDVHFGFGVTINTDLSKDLYIQVPRDWICRELEIDAASATLAVSDMTLGNVELDTASGVCRFDNCTVDTIDVDTASGDIRFNGSLNTLDFDGASAGIYAELVNCPNRIDVDSMSGDLDLTLPEDCGFTVSMNAMSSDFSSDFETATRNGNHVHGDGSCRISVDAMSGDVIIRKGQ